MLSEVTKIKFTRILYGERLKDLKFVIIMLNEQCSLCGLKIKDKTLKDKICHLQADTEKHLDFLDKAIRIVEQKDMKDE